MKLIVLVSHPQLISTVSYCVRWLVLTYLEINHFSRYITEALHWAKRLGTAVFQNRTPGLLQGCCSCQHTLSTLFKLWVKFSSSTQKHREPHRQVEVVVDLGLRQAQPHCPQLWLQFGGLEEQMETFFGRGLSKQYWDFLLTIGICFQILIIMDKL